MNRAVPAILITTAAFVLVWRFEPTPQTITAGPPATTSTGGGSSDEVVNGSPQGTRWGTVQVRAIFSGGRLTDIQMLQTPNDRHAIRALPVLKAEALQAQSANIDTVSGATATSEAYAQSLQAAIDNRNK